ncbi:MAG: NADH-quinone oxidoreductase subunit J [Proteobacteria bacterium]|nr:NADH-quinone oxidoreductase subunit J [Pseudomonadota bacterium]
MLAFADLVFYMFAAMLLGSAMGVIFAKNPMHCVLLLILTFFNAAGLFILLGAEFIGLLLVMVYVGAIAVMFLFVLMTIDIDFAVLKEGFASYLPSGLIVGAVLMAELVIAGQAGLFSGARISTLTAMPAPDGVENIRALGQVLFTHYLFPFQVAALILLVAMIGAIVLTHRRREGVRRQNVMAQIARTREDSLSIVKVKPGQGI